MNPRQTEDMAALRLAMTYVISTRPQSSAGLYRVEQSEAKENGLVLCYGIIDGCGVERGWHAQAGGAGMNPRQTEDMAALRLAMPPSRLSKRKV